MHIAIHDRSTQSVSSPWIGTTHGVWEAGDFCYKGKLLKSSIFTFAPDLAPILPPARLLLQQVFRPSAEPDLSGGKDSLQAHWGKLLLRT